MKAVKIIADTKEEALQQVQSRVGSEAVILNVRKVSADGMAALWSKPRIEIIATAPKKAAGEKELLRELAGKVEELESELIHRNAATPATAVPSAAGPMPAVQILEQVGLLPSHAQWLNERAQNFLGATKPRSLPEEMELLREVLAEHWHQLAQRLEKPGQPTRVLVGSPGSGKSTALAKWVTQESFLRQRPARIWRLDTDRPNTAEFLSLHGELLQVPVERVWEQDLDLPADALRFVDLPGVSPAQSAAMDQLEEQVKSLGDTQVLLVLNSAYDLAILLRQAQAFSRLPLSGIVLTHTDESNRWSKVWNLMLATQLPVTYLAGGQDIPGEFQPAIPETLFDAWIASAMQED